MGEEEFRRMRLWRSDSVSQILTLWSWNRTAELGVCFSCQWTWVSKIGRPYPRRAFATARILPSFLLLRCPCCRVSLRFCIVVSKGQKGLGRIEPHHVDVSRLQLLFLMKRKNNQRQRTTYSFSFTLLILSVMIQLRLEMVLSR